ncbi:MAG: tRNA threonylcarbamoyladenosine dehydratase [Firmicutes bacterium]|nr:tRNA threonylcarbamoyladenosine dehydratase [Bacillota bacterium]
MLDRLELLIGTENVEKLKNMTILVVGVGGVGGYAIEALARSGIGHLILVDYDKVDITNKNRQLIALDSTIGLKKIDVWEKRILDINKDCKVTKVDCFLSEDNFHILDDFSIDYLIDACDTVKTKKLLIKKCLNEKIPFISSMGTGNKLDPSKLEIVDIRKTSYDPLAKIIRKFVKEERLNGKVMVLSSKEIPISTGSTTIASCSFVPSSAGLLIASYIIRQVISKKNI